MRVPLILALFLTACAGGSVNYAGTMTPLSGVCDEAGPASLTLRGGKVVFAPKEGVLVLAGSEDGQDIAASRSEIDANKHPFILTFSGRLSGQGIEGTYRTPRCSYRIRLTRTGD